MSPAEASNFRRIDCHVHLIGDGSSGGGAWLRLRSPIRRLMARILVQTAGLPSTVLRGSLDRAYEELLVKLVRSSSLDAAVLLAHDLPHHDDGSPLPEKGAFYVPNSYLLDVCARHPGEFLPAVSIHPARRDAMAELERCLEAGARVLKLLPNCLNIDYANPRYRPFFKAMAAGRMILLSHTGGEFSLPVICPRYADPRQLEAPLDCGVTVIAAHCAGRSGLWDPDATADLLGMFQRWPNLFGDNSALCTPNRCATLPKILDPQVMERIIHGSDFPISIGGFGPWRMGLITRAEWAQARKIANPLERDIIIKQAIGFDSSQLTRLDSLLQSA